jgi:hypothetical protein
MPPVRSHRNGPALRFSSAETRFKKTIDLAEWLWHNSH